MIEATNLLKELADQKSDLGKLSQMDSSAFGDKGDNIYDETLAKPENVDLSDSPIDKPWYDESGDSKENIDDDLLDSQKEHHVSGDQGESEVAYNPSETNSDSGKIGIFRK